MEITTRNVAKVRGEKVYFTGQPCKNGHTTYRYVNNGGCSQCVKEANGQKSDPLDVERRAVKLAMIRVNLRAYVEDRATLAAGVYATALMRWPFVRESDVDPKLLPSDRSGGTALYAFHCHEEDIATVREISRGLVSARMSGVAQAVAAKREEVLRANLAAADIDTAPPMSFK